MFYRNYPTIVLNNFVFLPPNSLLLFRCHLTLSYLTYLTLIGKSSLKLFTKQFLLCFDIFFLTQKKDKSIKQLVNIS